MKRLFIAFLLLSCIGQVTAQTDQEKRFRDLAQKSGQDTSKEYGWKHSVVAGLNLSEVSFKDWAQGGENALSYTVYLNGFSVQNLEQTDWMNSYKLDFGQTRLGSQGLQKTDDDIYFESLLIYKFGLYVNPYVSATLRTQFAKGFVYDQAGNGNEISKFFDPAFLTQSVGAAYQPVPELTTRLGVGLREIVTSQHTHYVDPTLPEPQGNKTKVEGGLESATDLAWNFAENMLLTSKLEIFDAFKQMDHLIVRSDNTITAKVGKYIATSLNVQILNDPNVSPFTQIKQVLALGISYTLL